ncbi:MAG TPA: EamA family transporter [Anaerolineaceae bacterium]|nr:EamA family transporter [Anaerolineaceae bacterium]
MNERSSFSRGYPIALVAAVFLSTTAIFIRHLTQTYGIPALVLAFWRDVFVALSLLPILALVCPRLVRVERSHLAYLGRYGLVLATFNSIWTLSVTLNGAAVATVLAYSSAAFTALLGWLVLKERLDWVKILAVGLSIGGCVLVAGVLNPAARATGVNISFFGILAGALTGLCYAAYTLLGRQASLRGLNPWTTLLYTFAIASVILLIFNLLPGGVLPGAAARPRDLLWLGNAWAGWGVLLLLAAVPTLAGYGLYNVSLTFLPSSVANLIVTLEPAFTALFAYFLLGERLTLQQVAGAALIMAGVVFLRIFEGGRPRVSATGNIPPKPEPDL